MAAVQFPEARATLAPLSVHIWK